jgi:predicted nucleotide-binding protein (sugar kinase/HSP70/actin superfamily)
MGHLEPKTWTLKEWMKDQGTIEMEKDNKDWLNIVARLKAMKFGENQQHEISLFIMASYDVDTFSRFVFESSMLKRFKVKKKTVDLIRSDQLELLKFAMMWLQFTLFGEGHFAEKLNVKK